MPLRRTLNLEKTVAIKTKNEFQSRSVELVYPRCMRDTFLRLHIDTIALCSLYMFNTLPGSLMVVICVRLIDHLERCNQITQFDRLATQLNVFICTLRMLTCFLRNAVAILQHNYEMELDGMFIMLFAMPKQNSPVLKFILCKVVISKTLALDNFPSLNNL